MYIRTYNILCGGFTNTLFYCFRYSAELISKQTDEPTCSTPVKRSASRKRVMSIIGGMPYRKIYAVNGSHKLLLGFGC